METAPALVGVSHLTFPVGDLAVAEHFYVELLGLELLRRMDAKTFAAVVPDRAAELEGENSPLHLEVRCGALELDLFLQKGYRREHVPPHPHLAFEVDTDAFARFQARLSEHGVWFDGPRRLGPPGHASIYFPDPFGNLLELATFGHVGEIPIGPPDLRGCMVRAS